MNYTNLSSTPAATNNMAWQWTDPTILIPALFLFGGPILHQATARNVSLRLPYTPVCFSFGWVSYIFTLISAAAGSGKLMPALQKQADLTNANNGFIRENNSWIISRLFQDSEGKVNKAERLNSPPTDSTGNISLMLDIFTAKPLKKGSRAGSTIHFFSVFMTGAQFLISWIPWYLYDDSTIALITVLGSLLAVITASLPQWAAEKWSAAKCSKMKPVLLTKGNGHQYVMMIMCLPGSGDLETMATSRPVSYPTTLPAICTLAVCWLGLLVVASSIKQNAWYLIGVAAVGMMQNTIAATYPCKPEEHDIKLEPYAACPTIIGYQRTHESKKAYKKCEYDADFTALLDPETEVRDVMGVLIEVEKRFAKVGKALLYDFFPGAGVDDEEYALFDCEKEFWKHNWVVSSILIRDSMEQDVMELLRYSHNTRD